MMFDQTGQSVVLVTMPGLQPTAQPAPPPPQLQAPPQPTFYLPYNLVIKQEPDEKAVTVAGPQGVVSLQNQFLVPFATSPGVVVKQESGVDTTVGGGQRPLLCAPITVGSDNDTLSILTLPVGEVKQELSSPVVPDTKPAQPLLIGQPYLQQLATGTLPGTSQAASVDEKPACLKPSPVASPIPSPPAEAQPLLDPPPPTEPDITALTTLAIVCDNVGSGRDSQYIVKVQLEEPVNSPPTSDKACQDNLNLNIDSQVTEPKREKPGTKSENTKKTHAACTKSGKSTKTGQAKRSQRLKNELNKVSLNCKKLKLDTSSELEEKSSFCSTQSIHATTNNERHKTLAERRSKRETTKLGSISSKKRTRKPQPPPGEAVMVEDSILIREPETAPTLTDITSPLPSIDIDIKVESVAELSPASTIPYGEDSNDSVDLTGRSTYRCNLCSKSYTSDRRLRLHIGLLHQESDKSPLSAIFSCPLCTKAYTSQKRLDLHTLLVHPDPSSPDTESLHRKKLFCDSDTKGSDKKKRKRKRSSTGKLKEDPEGLEFSEGDYLEGTRITEKEFWAAVSDTAPFSCILCGKQYASRNRLDLHFNLCHRRKRKTHVGPIALGLSVVSNQSKRKHKQPTSPLKGLFGNVPGATVKTDQLSDSGSEDVVIKEEPIDLEMEYTEKEKSRTHAKGRPRHSCPKCGLVFMSMDLYQLHLPVHKDEKHPNFDLKKKKNRRVVIEKYYMAIAANRNRPYRCRICDKNFTERRICTNHISNVHEIYDGADKIFSCSHCEKQFTKRSFLQRHTTIHTRLGKPKEYKCTECDQTFTQKPHAVRHYRLTHMDVSLVRIFTCDLCDKRFKLKAHLVRHMKGHQGTLPFECLECGFMCADRHALQNHFRVHTGEKPFNCSYCSKSFTLKSTMQSHTANWHPETLSKEELKTHQCKICGRIMCKGSLKVHLKAHAKKRSLKCEECGKSFTLRSHLRDHLNVVHDGGLPFQCGQCPKRFKNKPQLRHHLSKYH